MIDYKLLEALNSVVEFQTFEKAATNLHITQSAVSQRIKLLEEQTGQILLVRSSPPRPTKQGKKYLTHFHKVSHLEDSFSRELNSINRSSLSIAVNADTMATWLSDVLSPYLTNHNIVLDLHVDDQDQTHKKLQNGEVLACLGTFPKPLQGCSCEYLGYETYGLYCSDTFYNKWFPDGFTQVAAFNAPSINFNRKDNLNFLLTEKIFGTKSDLKISFNVPSTELFSEFIIKGVGYGALPDKMIDTLGNKERIISLGNDVRIKTKLYFHYWNVKSSLLQNFTDAFIKNSRKILNQD